MIQREETIGKVLSLRFESGIKFRTDQEVSAYLRKLAQTMIDSNPEVDSGSVGVWLILDKQGKWQNFSLPGNRLYLSVGALKLLKYENEIAAMVAIQLGHIIGKHVLGHIKNHFEQKKLPKEDLKNEGEVLTDASLRRLGKRDFFDPGGIFSFSEDEMEVAVRAAAKILYRAGYDPRGMISVFNLCQDNSEKCPYEPRTVHQLIEVTRREIASSAPLRNPIVRSRSFLHIQKRIQHL